MMLELNEPKMELEILRKELTRRLDELQAFINCPQRPSVQSRSGSFGSLSPQQAVPPVIRNVNRQRSSRIVVSTGSQTEELGPLGLTRSSSPSSGSNLSLSRQRLGLERIDSPKSVTTPGHHRERLASCISDIRARLASIQVAAHPRLLRSTDTKCR